ILKPQVVYRHAVGIPQVPDEDKHPAVAPGERPIGEVGVFLDGLPRLRIEEKRLLALLSHGKPIRHVAQESGRWIRVLHHGQKTVHLRGNVFRPERHRLPTPSLDDPHDLRCPFVPPLQAGGEGAHLSNTIRSRVRYSSSRFSLASLTYAPLCICVLYGTVIRWMGVRYLAIRS